MDLLHHYIGTLTPAEKQEVLDRQVTGPLDTYQQPAQERRLRPPAWVRITPADIERMNQHRNT